MINVIRHPIEHIVSIFKLKKYGDRRETGHARKLSDKCNVVSIHVHALVFMSNAIVCNILTVYPVMFRVIHILYTIIYLLLVWWLCKNPLEYSLLSDIQWLSDDTGHDHTMYHGCIHGSAILVWVVPRLRVSTWVIWYVQNNIISIIAAAKPRHGSMKRWGSSFEHKQSTLAVYLDLSKAVDIQNLNIMESEDVLLTGSCPTLEIESNMWHIWGIILIHAKWNVGFHNVQYLDLWCSSFILMIYQIVLTSQKQYYLLMTQLSIWHLITWTIYTQ